MNVQRVRQLAEMVEAIQSAKLTTISGNDQWMLRLPNVTIPLCQLEDGSYAYRNKAEILCNEVQQKLSEALAPMLKWAKDELQKEVQS